MRGTWFITLATSSLLLACAAEDPGLGGQNLGGNTAGVGAAGTGAAGTGVAGTGVAGTLGTAGTGTAGSGAAGTGIDLGDNCTATGAEAEVERQGADIVWVVDNSCSMAAEAAAVQSNMNRFAQSLISKGIDVRLVLISAGGVTMCDEMDPNFLACFIQQAASLATFGVCIDAPFGSGTCPEDSLPPNYLHLPNVVSSTDALVQIIDRFPMYSSMLRPDAKKHFVVVTDDESEINATAFTQSANALNPALLSDWDFHGIFAQTDCPDAAQVGTVYQQLVTQTGGVASDLCLQQFDPVFDQLAMDVVGKSEAACDWVIPPAPIGQTLNPEKVNVRLTKLDGSVVDLPKVLDAAACGTGEGWYYDNENAPTTVLSCPTSCEGFRSGGGKVDVLFGCNTFMLE